MTRSHEVAKIVLNAEGGLVRRQRMGRRDGDHGMSCGLWLALYFVLAVAALVAAMRFYWRR